jgi:hypothetical protein
MDYAAAAVFGWLAVFVCCLLRLLIVQHRLMSYLERHHHERWCYLTSVGNAGPGLANGFRSVPYLYSKDDEEDPEAARPKLLVRRSAAVVFGVLLAPPLCLLVFFVVQSILLAVHALQRAP